ncbi:hypothetical protein SKAU_G00064040 [Synaphobranchus kaupii]|uniref:Uncharacterized protein n=1 Tax=Synaphobranchus kaupii TaxID=118154 RepID=A0A9Q1J8W4_SYNKA|nr:hypothetical protein SKAU_G00064040 [Synaphobranchus kaupii]
MKLSVWLDLPPGLSLEIERAHRSLGPIPGTGNPPRSVVDLSAEVMRKRREFSVVRKALADRDMFRGFAYPARLRCMHNGKLHTFLTPAAVKDFLNNIKD